jgi:transposase
METIVTGYERFYQLKEWIKSDRPILIVGIDVGKNQHTACLRTAKEVLVRRLSFDNSRAGFERLQERVREAMQKQSVVECVYGLESTGNYHKPLAYFLNKAGGQVVLVSTLAVRRNRETLDVSWDKNDRKDAENIADLVRQGKFFYAAPPGGLYAETRRLLGHYQCLQAEQSKLKTKMRNDMLSLIFPELEGMFSDMGSKLLRKILQQTPFPSQIRRLSLEEFERGLKGFGRSWKKIGQAYQAACESIGIEAEKESIGVELEYWLERYDQLEEKMSRLEKKIYGRLEGVKGYQLLQTIPGVGPYLAAVLWSEIGDIEHYECGRQLVKLAGLDIAHYQSGKFCSEGKISRRGREGLRAAVYQAAVVAVGCDRQFKSRYQRLLQRQGADPVALKALMAIGAKILRIAFRVLKDGQPYDPNYDLKIQIKYRQKKAEGRIE